MDFQLKAKVYHQLFELVSGDDANEDRVIQLLDTPEYQEYIKELINMPHDGETMLMWAVWRQKKAVVQKLIEKGADATFVSPSGESVATYWSFTSCRGETPSNPEQEHAIEIAKLLHGAGADLSKGSHRGSYGLVLRAKEYRLDVLSAGLQELGYQP